MAFQVLQYFRGPYQIGGMYMEKLVITGPTPLRGDVKISGAKNAAVAIIPATILIMVFVQ